MHCIKITLSFITEKKIKINHFNLLCEVFKHNNSQIKIIEVKNIKYKMCDNTNLAELTKDKVLSK
jgi:hypothetical protein